MILVIPAIDIKGGKCVQMVRGVAGFVYSDDPIEMAKLWRKENAKALHVTDIDGAMEGHLVNFGIIEKMVETVSIPIVLAGGFRTFDEVKRADAEKRSQQPRGLFQVCLLYTSPSPRDGLLSRMPSSA